MFRCFDNFDEMRNAFQSDHNYMKKNLPGKWFKIEMLQVPHDFASNFLSVLEVPLNGIADVHHWRAPKLSSLTRRYSYKISDFDKLRLTVEEQKVIKLKQEVFFRNGTEVEENIIENNRKSADDILEDVVNQVSLNSPRESCQRSSVIVGGSDGRTSRELECIWYPKLYSHGVLYGKLDMRIYVSKIREL